MLVTPEELIAGQGMTFEVEIPPHVLHPGTADAPASEVQGKRIRLRPLTVRDVQLIARAARDDDVLTSVLMIQRAVVEPKLKQSEISEMHSGLVRYLVDQINQISGLSTTEDDMRQVAESPIVQAFFILAKEFNWTPQQIREMTVGEILGYLELLNRSKRSQAP